LRTRLLSAVGASDLPVPVLGKPGGGGNHVGLLGDWCRIEGSNLCRLLTKQERYHYAQSGVMVRAVRVELT
jgi:hypothetical protein